MATVTTQERTNILKLVAGMFNAAPGAAYLNEFTDAYVAMNKDLGALANALGQTGAFKSVYPSFLSAKEFANKFLDTLGLKANTEAQDWVKAKVNAGEGFASVVFQALVAIEASTDEQFKAARDQLANKAAVAEYYSVTLQASSDDLAALQNVVAKVTADPASVTAANEANAGGNGKTFTLTANQDAPGALAPSIDTQGTVGNDTYIGVLNTDAGATSTLQATDSIDGAGGVDTLQIVGVGTAANTVTPLFLKNVEKVSVKDIQATNGTTVDLVNATGVTEVINDGSVGAVVFDNIGTAAVSVKGVTTAATTTTTTFTRGTSPVTADLTINVENHGKAAAPGSVAVTGGAINSDDGDNDATSVTINATGAVRIDTMNVTGTTASAATHTATSVTLNAAGETTFVGATGITGFDLTKSATLTVNGAGKVDLSALAAVVQTVNASANTGGVTLTGTQYAAPGTNAAALAAPGLKLTGGTGNDSFSFNGVASADVSLGAGNDTAIVNGALTAGVKIAGGEGTDTLVLTQAAITSLNDTTTAANNIRAGITGFEVLGISNTLATAFNVNTVGAYNTLQVRGDVDDSGAGTSVAVTGFTDGATVEFRASPTAAAGPLAPFVQEDILSVGMTGAALNTNATLNLNLNANPD